MEILLETWIGDKRRKGFRMTGDKIRKKAKELVNDLFNIETDFKASKGWLWNFQRRFQWVQRRKQNQQDPKDLIPKLVRFILYIRKILAEKTY